MNLRHTSIGFAFLLATMALVFVSFPGKANAQATINFLSITSAGGTVVTIEYEVDFTSSHTEFPTVTWPDKEPYWVLLRSQGGDPQDLEEEETPPVEEDQREIIPESKRVEGIHEIDIDLRQTKGSYSFVLCTEPPETFGYFGASFTIKPVGGVVTITSPVNDDPNHITPVTEDEPFAAAPKAPPKCASCAAGTIEGALQSVPTLGDTAFDCSVDALDLSEVLGQVGGSSSSATSPGDCSSCGISGSSGSGLGSTTPGIPFRLQFAPQLSGYQSSFGPGVIMPFDSTLHAFMVKQYTYPMIRLVDAAVGLVSYFSDLPLGTGTPDGIMIDTYGLYRDARLLDSGDALVTQLDDAVKVVVTRLSGETMTFELFDFDTDGVMDKEGRMVNWLDNNGKGYFLSYSDDFEIATISSSWGGGNFSCSYGANIGGRSAISGVTLPGGAQASISYTSDLPSSIQVTPSGGGAAIWQWSNTVSLDSGTDTIRCQISSPTRGTRIFRFYDDYRWVNSKYMKNPLLVLHSVYDSADSGVIARVLPKPNDTKDEYVLIQLGDTRLMEVRNGY